MLIHFPGRLLKKGISVHAICPLVFIDSRERCFPADLLESRCYLYINGRPQFAYQVPGISASIFSNLRERYCPAGLSVICRNLYINGRP